MSLSSHVTNVSSESKLSDESTSYDFSLHADREENRPRLTQSATNLTVFNSHTTPSDTTKRYQTKMLLASLIEHFCRAYGDKPDANRKVFFLICQTLRSLGIIDAEFVDEMTHVRSSFKQAFHKLFFTAVQTVRNGDILQFDDNLPRLIKQDMKAQEEEEEESIEFSTSTSESSTSEANYFKRKPTSIPTHKTPKEGDYFSSHGSSSNTVATSFTALTLSPGINTKPSSCPGPSTQAESFFHNLNVQNSRYNNDFVQLNLLGKGGFASAFRARNKLDGIDYAVKKIRLGNDIEENQDESYEKIFREIKNLARLEHINVIRYYSSWLEFDVTEAQGDDEDGSEWDDESFRPVKSPYTDESSIFNGNDPTFDEELSFGIHFDDGPSESGMSQIQFGDSSGGYEAGGNESSTSTRRSYNPTPRSNIPQQTGWTLFIQMQLCPTTLHDYIKLRNKQHVEMETMDQVDMDRNIEIFSQILQGTAYIHDQGLIHRDLKPSNIFLSMPQSFVYTHRKRSNYSTSCSESSFYGSSATSRSSYDAVVSEKGLKDSMWEESWVPKIGDFGLAAETIDEGEETILVPSTPMACTPPSPKVGLTLENARSKRPKPKRTRTVGVGTRTYASPEQLAAQSYDEKVDIYSLGIILFELFQPFSTGMERAASLDQLKEGVFPDGFLERYPKVSALIIWMMNEKPEQRPSAAQLLEFELFTHSEEPDMHASLYAQLQQKTIMIDELKKKLDRVQLEKRLALNEMQQRLDDMQRQLDLFTKDQPIVKKKKEVRWSLFNHDT